ncbi:flotillin-like protein [Synechococcus sp. MIT S9220]|uniref:flotillin family protein n=1 Tax=unclassified Synechococcus TaxID=2626047 RepID=UPI00164C3DD6|nr:SPFH domain-containing protein [Synechococcus sp. MIT S9220]NOL47446.1 flotillin family protein [Synechococcus sp. MIT S9220]QNJ22216.1 flotillin-like protein [Synechococcus sp. MIT S9220]|tara:strand:- start:91 stop:1350 length:1260 start_codon:yes stop_codon:yes gene_type:complete
MFFAVGLTGAAGLWAFVVLLRQLYYICQPSEVLIFAGLGKTTGDGRKVGYRTVRGGSALRIPVLEEVMRLDLSNMIIELRVENAYSKGGIPLNVAGVANIKISGDEPGIHNAIERLIGKSQDDIRHIAKETLEGNLRGVMASLTPEQLNEDKITFARTLLEEAEDDLQKLGLVLDTLQIQNISDDVRYLDSIGRKQLVELKRDSRIAEAEATSQSAVKQAENARITSLRRLDKELAIATANAQKRIKDALTRRDALVAEVDAQVGAELARAEAELPVQEERIKQVMQQLEADVIAPAESECETMMADAKGAAASIVEQGRSQAEGLQELVTSLKRSGSDAKRLFLLQKLEPLLTMLSDTVQPIEVEEVSLIGERDGQMNLSIATLLRQLQDSTGLRLPNAIEKASIDQTSTSGSEPTSS